MASKEPVLVGTVTTVPEAGGPNVDRDVIINVSPALYAALGSPTFDPTLLGGSVQTGPNGDYIYPKQGTSSGKTVTFFTDGTTPTGKVKTFQAQFPEYCPGHVIDKWLSGLTLGTPTIQSHKVRNGRKIPVGQTIVTV